jgi:5,10-methylenetetrahydrofolate reductase
MNFIVRLREENRTANVVFNPNGSLPSYEVEYLEDKINRGVHFFNTQFEAVQSALQYTSEGVMK